MAIPKRDYRLKVAPEVMALISKANAGDAEALWELQRLFDRDEDLYAYVGDLAGLAETMIVGLVIGDKALALNEGIFRQLNAIDRELGAECETELEKLLARRVSTGWLWAAVADIQLVQAQKSGSTATAAVGEATRQVDRAQARYLAALKALAQVKALCRPPRSPLSLLKAAAGKSEPAPFRRPTVEDPEPARADRN